MGSFRASTSPTILTDLDVDSGTISVDTANDRVGIGTTSPTAKLEVEQSSTGGETVVLIDNDDADQITLDIDAVSTGAAVVHVTNAAVNDQSIVLIETTAAETDAVLELRNSNSALDKPPILKFNRSDSTAEADNMDLGQISFFGVDDGNTSTEYVQVLAEGPDVTNTTEDGRITFDIRKTGTLRNHLSMGNGNIVFNEDSKDINFRIESDVQTEAFYIDGEDGAISLNYTSAAAPGGGFDQANAVSAKVSKINGEIVTTILVDIDGLSVGAGEKDVIGENGVAAAYLTQITTAVNGVIYKAEMSCVETPATLSGATTADIDLVSNSNSLAQGADYDSAGTAVVLIAATAGYKAGTHRQSAAGADFENVVDDYLYLAAGAAPGGSGGRYSAGKFIIKLYGASFVGQD